MYNLFKAVFMLAATNFIRICTNKKGYDSKFRIATLRGGKNCCILKKKKY